MGLINLKTDDMTIAMTLEERIMLAERLPRNGALERMAVVKGIRQKLVGFTTQQMHDYDIVQTGRTFVTGYPDTRINVTFTDDMVKVYASIIKEMSLAGEISEAEATLYQTIATAANALEQAEQEGQQQGEGGEE